MKILITGIHGFVGSNLVVSLQKEHTIYGLDIISLVKDGVIRTYSWDNLDAGRLNDKEKLIVKFINL